MTFAEPKLDKPTIRLISVAFNYDGIGGELYATLNDQIGLNAELAFLAEKGGYEFESYLFTQKGKEVHEEVSALYLEEVDGEIVFSSIEFNDDAKAVNLIVTETTSEGISTYEKGIYMEFPESAQLNFLLKDGYVYSFSMADIEDMESYYEAIDALNDGVFNYSNENITVNGIPYVFADIYDFFYVLDSMTDMSEAAIEACREAINNDESIDSYYQYRYNSDGMVCMIENKILEIAEIAKDSDITIFQYSGHGSADIDPMYGGSLYFNRYDNLYPYMLNGMLSEVPGKKLVILDSCYSGAHTIGPFDTPDTFTEALDAALSVSIAADDGIWTLSAARYNEVAYDGGEGTCGVFTGALLKALGAEMEEDGLTLSFIAPGLPSGNSIWVSELLDETRKEINRFKVLNMQYPMGDSILDLKLFDNLK